MREGYEYGRGHRHGGRGYDERDNHGEYGLHGGYSKHGGYGPYSGAGVYGMHAGWGMFGEPMSHEDYIEGSAEAAQRSTGHHEGCHCGAGLGHHGGRRFQRKYWSKSEVLDELRSYLSDLHSEVSAVEEHLTRLERSED